MRSRVIILVLLWLALLAAALAFADRPVSQWVYDHRFHDAASHLFKMTPWARAMRAMGYFPTTIAIVVGLMLLARLHWRRAVIVLICSATAAINDPLKWIAGRARPILHDGTLDKALDFVPFTMREAGNAMPSGHTMLAFATATCLGWYYPRWAWLWYSLAAVVAAERVLEAAHYVSDVVAAAGLAIIICRLLLPLLERKIGPQLPLTLPASVPASRESKAND